MQNLKSIEAKCKTLFFLIPLVLFVFSSTCSFGQQQIKQETFTTGIDISLRGLSAVSKQVVWTSGNQGSVLRTIDGGTVWQDVSPEGYESLQFRDIEAFNEDTAIILSAGLPAVVCKTTNGGISWKEVYRNQDEGVFFDAMDFWDHKKGIAFSDAPDNKVLVIKTEDGGESWSQIPYKNLPAVSTKQGGFAASGTCLETFGTSSALIGLGGPEATILRTDNYGDTWTKHRAPIDFGEPSKGIFSIAMYDEEIGLCVGGDYRADSLSNKNMALTEDGGYTWQPLINPGIENKYFSAVSFYSKNIIIATSRTGIRFSVDGGQNWNKLNGSYYSVDCLKGLNTCWCSGPKGAIGKLTF